MGGKGRRRRANSKTFSIPKGTNLIMEKHFSAMVISVHKVMYQEYNYTARICQENIYSHSLTVHTAEGLLTNEMLKNLGSEVLTGKCS